MKQRIDPRLKKFAQQEIAQTPTVSSVDLFAQRVAELKFDPHDLTDKIISFGRALTGITIYNYQYEAIYRVIYSVIIVEGATITQIWSRQSGKTESLAFTAATLGTVLPALANLIPDLSQYRHGVRIGLFAPQSDQVATTYGRTMGRLKSSNAEFILADPEINATLLSKVNYRLTNGSFMLGQTASKNSKIESKTYDLVFIEEAQDIDSYLVEKSIEPMVTATNGTIVKSGTTGRTKNNFFVEIQNNKRIDRSCKDDRLKLHYENDYKKVTAAKRKAYEEDGNRFHLNYELNVKKTLEKYGAESETFKLSYKLEWNLEEGTFITDEKFESLVNGRMGFPKVLDKEWAIVAGLDIGKDKASTVLTILAVTRLPNGEFHKRIIHWLELKYMSYEDQHHALIQALVDWNVETIMCDYTGVGKPVVDRLGAAVDGYIQVEPWVFSTPSKSEMWTRLLTEIDANRIEVPGNKIARNTEEFKRFEAQCKEMEKRYEGPYLVCEKPRNGFDDYLDSLGLANIAVQYRFMGDELDGTALPLEEQPNFFFEDALSDREMRNFCAW